MTATSATLTQPVPALVERDLHGPHALEFVLAQRSAGVRPFQAVLLIGELVDAAYHFEVIHRSTPLH